MVRSITVFARRRSRAQTSTGNRCTSACFAVCGLAGRVLSQLMPALRIPDPQALSHALMLPRMAQRKTLCHQRLEESSLCSECSGPSFDTACAEPLFRELATSALPSSAAGRKLSALRELPVGIDAQQFLVMYGHGGRAHFQPSLALLVAARCLIIHRIPCG